MKLIHKISNFKFAILILGAIILSACKPSQPQISIEMINFDFGDVVNGTIMSKEILMKNDGEAPLIVESVSTSCSCTTASLESMVIEPGSSATLIIEFDSGAHGPELTGELIRQIFIVSNDPNLPEAEIVFSSNIILPENAN